MKNELTPSEYVEYKDKATEFIKSKMFDIIAAFTIIIMMLLSLSALELRDISFETLFDILVECLPFYLAATMLSKNYYTKGVYLGKEQEVFKNAVSYYSEYVTKLTGDALNMLPKFCSEYNRRILQGMQESLLASVALTFDKFDEKDDKVGMALKIAPYEKIKTAYGKYVADVVEKCKKIKIKGICPNVLLSNINKTDSTDLGHTEKELARSRTVSYAIGYIINILLISLISIKQILEWGWVGMFLSLFKLAFVVFTAFTRHYEGYEDITVHVVDHYFRKTDVLKEFEYWRSCLAEENNKKE